MQSHQYDSVLEDVRQAVLVVGEDGVVLFANQAARVALGRPDEDLVGRQFSGPGLGIRTLDDEPLTDTTSPVEQVIRSGQAVGATSYLSRHPDGSVAILSLAARPMALDEGSPGVSVELAEAATLPSEGVPTPTIVPSGHWETQARRLQALAQTSGLLSSVITVEQAFEQITEYASVLFDVPACVALREDTTAHVFTPAAVSGLERQLPNRALSPQDVRRLGIDRPVPVVITDIGPLEHIDFFRQLRSLGYRSAVCLGLVTETGTQGIVLLLRREAVVLTEDDLVMLRLFGTMSAASLYVAERHETHERVARTVQQALLSIPAELPGIDHAGLYRSATRGAAIGGDFYDLFTLPDGRIAILIGDISGKGLGASLLMAQLKNAVKAFSYTSRSPAEIMGLCNRLLIDVAPSSSFATAFLAFYDAGPGCVEYCCAGHPPPLLAHADGSVDRLEHRSMVLGMLPDASYTAETVEFARDELIFLYTDGITEARSGQEFLGEGRLLELLSATAAKASSQEIVEQVFGAVNAFAGGEFSDDVAVLAVRCTRSM